jgi:hypothetical protein
MQLTARDRRLLIVLAGVVVVGALLYFFVLSGNKSKPVASPKGGGSLVIQPGSSPAAAASPSPGARPILVFAGRDPFSPPPGALVGVASPATGGSAPTVSPAGTSNSAPGGGSSATVGGKTVVLDSIFTMNGSQEAQVEVNGTVYTVAPGGTFATSYSLTSINGSCADFKYKTTTFTLCATANK